MFSCLPGRHPAFGPPGQAGLAPRLPTPRLPLPHAAPDRGRRAPPRGRHAPVTAAPGRPVAPASLRARLLPPRARPPLLLPPIASLHPTGSSSKPSGFLRHREPPQHPLLSCSSTAPPLPDSSCAQLRLAFLFLVLAPSLRFALEVRLNRVFPRPWRHGRRSWPCVARVPSALSLFCLRHQHRLHLAELVHALLATTTACSGRPSCASTAVPPCLPASSMPSSPSRVFSATGFTLSRGVEWW
jgi:hypothetical protein